MTKLWILLAVSLLLAWIIDNRNRTFAQRKIDRKDWFFTCVLILVLGFFCGLRTWGNDTITYYHIFMLTPTWDSWIAAGDFDVSSGLGFIALTSIFKTNGFSAQDYLMFFAFATIILYVLFVRRYSQSMVFGVFLMFATGFYTFSMAAVKQCMALGICLWALAYAIDRKWIRFLLLIALATLFHPYAVVYLLVPFMLFRPWTTRTTMYVCIFTVVGFALESLLGVVLDVTDMIGANYTMDSFTGEGVNIFRVLVCFVPMMLAAVYGKSLFTDSSRTDNLMFNLAMLNALIMFVGLFGTANYFARLANYFLPAQVIVIPWLFNKAPVHDRTWLKPASVIGYLGYFFYENAIIRPFDTGYSHMSLWKYLADLF